MLHVRPYLITEMILYESRTEKTLLMQQIKLWIVILFLVQEAKL